MRCTSSLDTSPTTSTMRRMASRATMPAGTASPTGVLIVPVNLSSRARCRPEGSQSAFNRMGKADLTGNQCKRKLLLAQLIYGEKADIFCFYYVSCWPVRHESCPAS